MQKITPNLWCKGNAEEVVNFYLSIFPHGRIISKSYYPAKGLLDFQKPFAGKVLAIYFELWEYQFVAINAGNEFTPTPSNSFLINFDLSHNINARTLLEQMWEQLIAGGKILMQLGKYDFSELYGWLEDQYGFSWQLLLTQSGGTVSKESYSPIVPFFMFTGSKPQAKQAIDFYQAVFKNSRLGNMRYYGPDTLGMEDMVMYADFTLDGQWFAAIDGGAMHQFTFTPAVSYNIACKDQAEIDYFWEKLSVVPQAEQCGWCQDKFGISWQINPEDIEELMRISGAWERLLKMKKIVIAELKQ